MDEEDTPMDEAPKTQPEEPLPKDQDLIDFLNKMSDFQPIIPDAVTDHYLSKSGFECPDIRMYSSILSLLINLVNDSYHLLLRRYYLVLYCLHY